jgi:hypothetical protein
MYRKINNSSNLLKKSSLPLEKGDVFFVFDNQGDTLSHSIIRRGQQLTGNSHAEIVHVGIALDSKNLVEMSGSGIVHSAPEDIHGQKVIIFRFKDKKVTDLAADLAYDMEATYLSKHYPQLNASPLNIHYGFISAALSCVNHSPEMNSHQQEELEQLVNTFDFQNTLYCSEFVVLLFAMSKLILEKSEKAPDSPLECDLHSTNPSQLYEHLLTHLGYERIEIFLDQHAEEPLALEHQEVSSVSPVASEKAEPAQIKAANSSFAAQLLGWFGSPKPSEEKSKKTSTSDIGDAVPSFKF